MADNIVVGIVGNEAPVGKLGASVRLVMSQWRDEQVQSRIHLTATKEAQERGCCFSNKSPHPVFFTGDSTADQRRDLGHSPVTYQLRSNQLRNPALSKQKLLQPAVEPTFQSLQGSQTRELTSDQVVVKFEERVPVSADSVVVHCGEGEVTMQVKQNFLGNGQFIHPGDLTLGGCTALHVADNILQFQAELHGCGSTMSMTEDVLIYTFSLMYFPRPIGNTFILKTNPAEVLIECHYQRRQHVSSNAMTPTWKPFASNVSAQQQLHFSLHLMTEDWKSPRASSVYNLSDMMHVEVSVRHGHHVPMRVYADSCVSTESPNPYSQPRYAIIRSHGCLTNAKLTGAKSYFMQRSQEDKLQFQLKAFKFHQDPRNSWEETASLGPILLENNPWLTKLSEIPQEPASMLQTHVVIQAETVGRATGVCHTGRKNIGLCFDLQSFPVVRDTGVPPRGRQRKAVV
ncbi:Zona pellucida sperm-binding protein 3 [Channa argus]|uniref:Zona pellucida sperm-binding protein 3 n=1 Tax=Channa argus TaxID=215402 RepID=A0A6G1QUU0_CHAAH|nr:Zona pellucida sperm-binding protein 3 [Channa argus]